MSSHIILSKHFTLHMKKITFILTCLLLGTFSLQSCLNDTAYTSENLLFAIGTIRVIEKQDYYFELDEGSRLYPNDTTAVHNYPIKDNQRAFVYFSLLEEKLSDYEFNAKIEHIEDILTKDIYCCNQAEKLDSIGNDRIDVDNIWLSQDHINIVYKFYHSNNPEKKHMLNLILNEAAKTSNDEYLHLEFCHNAYNDTPLQSGTGIVSFKLDNIRQQPNANKGLCIVVNTLYEGTKTFIIEKNH